MNFVGCAVANEVFPVIDTSRVLDARLIIPITDSLDSNLSLKTLFIPHRRFSSSGNFHATCGGKPVPYCWERSIKKFKRGNIVLDMDPETTPKNQFQSSFTVIPRSTTGQITPENKSHETYPMSSISRAQTTSTLSMTSEAISKRLVFSTVVTTTPMLTTDQTSPVDKSEIVCTVFWGLWFDNETHFFPYPNTFIPEEIGKLPFYGSPFIPSKLPKSKCGYKVPTYDTLCEVNKAMPTKSYLLFVCDFDHEEYQRYRDEIANLKDYTFVADLVKEFERSKSVQKCASTRCNLWENVTDAHNLTACKSMDNLGFGYIDYDLFMEIGFNFTDPVANLKHACELIIYTNIDHDLIDIGRLKKTFVKASSILSSRHADYLSKAQPNYPDDFSEFYWFKNYVGMEYSQYLCSSKDNLCNWIDHHIAMNMHRERVNLTGEFNLTKDLSITCFQEKHEYHRDQSIARALSCSFKEWMDKNDKSIRDNPKRTVDSDIHDCICDHTDQCYMFPNQTESGCVSRIREILYYGDPETNGHHEHLLFCSVPETRKIIKAEEKNKQRFLIAYDNERYQEVTCCAGSCNDNVQEAKDRTLPDGFQFNMG